ncbi:hypothetical protein [Campylobacter canadensis]|uniref:Uncharacterized protein n=1 Tax=Campylobacter canadensis TaxID=449520 RepID=A0ABS7WSI4_9BACT|nr:hypothetical protein [Campylobacter canadensis]MBZ7987731.1 hypothetical protein [Campylobacter canadensis]MBZ7994138.1 hypothetical protein [Campylobacter canadensis]MBZ7995859.1 hypothetical protein [Campylobacter canadensis]MBZ7997496.1 hypothetical protein [Campylobacter canadensis]MBZ7999469.1 hypothetical protein [Campylobacter canadensis]
MIFLIPLIIFIAILFGIDYAYFQKEDANAKQILFEKSSQNKKINQEKIDEYIRKINNDKKY